MNQSFTDKKLPVLQMQLYGRLHDLEKAMERRAELSANLPELNRDNPVIEEQRVLVKAAYDKVKSQLTQAIEEAYEEGRTQQLGVNSQIDTQFRGGKVTIQLADFYAACKRRQSYAFVLPEGTVLSPVALTNRIRLERTEAQQETAREILKEIEAKEKFDRHDSLSPHGVSRYTGYNEALSDVTALISSRYLQEDSTKNSEA